MIIEAAAAAAKSLQSCSTLCDPIDGSPPGSPVPGILQARTLEWVAVSLKLESPNLPCEPAGWRPRELMFQIKCEGSLLENSLLLRKVIPFVLLRPSSD